MYEEIPITILWPSYKPPPRTEEEPEPEIEAKPDQIALPKPSKPPRARNPKSAKPAEKKPPIKPIILATLREHGPAGVDQMARNAGLQGNQINPRLHAMMEAGQIRLTGRMVVSDANAPQREWEIVPREAGAE